VFAIAITLLVLEIRSPEPMPGSHASRLSIVLVEELWPDFYSFLISFWFVGRDYDRGLLLVNLFFLMWIVLLPFSATLLSRFEDQQVAVVIYALHVAVAEFSAQHGHAPFTPFAPM
jgi:uncharacterized membrane protein